MIKKILSFLATVIICSSISIIASNFIVRAGSAGGSGVTVMATIQPNRIIIVDKNITIVSILSNTTQDVRPLVFLESLDGRPLPYSESIVEQYSALKPSLDFSRPGVAYEKGNNSVQGIFTQSIRFFRELL